ncbi:MAG TPA: hypothetical protein PKW15_01550 [Alphaproteobacteria bacterium]|nr:hypothetical protein [Rhodospirillaceae bacterium]HRJ11909.1 hypothetical protein [Alphaproteobacteria bacterium]
MSVLYRRCVNSRRGLLLSHPVAKIVAEKGACYFSHHPQNPSRIYTHFPQHAWQKLAIEYGMSPDRAEVFAKNTYVQQERHIARDKEGNKLEPRTPVRHIQYAYEA